MGNRMKVVMVIGGLVLAVALQGRVWGFSVDGNLADWGVNLQLQNSGGNYTLGGGGPYTKFVATSFGTTTEGVVSSIQNDTLVNGGSTFIYPNSGFDNHGGEFCDVEALYAYFDTESVIKMAYFAVVTSSNPNGTTWDGYGNARFGPGDLKVRVGLNVFGIGARPFALNLHGGDIGYGAADERNPATWQNVDPGTYGGLTLTTTQADVRTNDPNPLNPLRLLKWSHVDNSGILPGQPGYDAYFVGNTGKHVCDATAAWRQQQWMWNTQTGVWDAVLAGGTTGVGDYSHKEDPYGREEPYSTWVYEVCVPFADLGIVPNVPNLVILEAFAVDCGNDRIEVQKTVAYSETPGIPEASTLGLLGLGLIGLVRRRRS